MLLWELDVPVIGDCNTPIRVRVLTSSSANRSKIHSCSRE